MRVSCTGRGLGPGTFRRTRVGSVSRSSNASLSQYACRKVIHRWKGFESLGSRTSHHVALPIGSPTPAAARIISVMAGFNVLQAPQDFLINTI